MAIAKTKAKEAISQIAALLQSGDELSDEFSLRRIRRELMASMKSDASMAYAGLGMLETLLWNADEAEANFRKAIQLDSEFTVHSNYAISLGRLGKLSAAAEQARLAADYAPTDVRAVERAAHYSMLAGELEDSSRWADRLSNLTPNSKHEESLAVHSIRAVFEKTGFDEVTMQQCNSVAFSLLASNRVIVNTMSTEADIEDGIALFTLEINASDADAERLDQKLGTLLFDTVPDFDPSKYWVGYTPGSRA